MATLEEFKVLRAGVALRSRRSCIHCSPLTPTLPVSGWLSWQQSKVMLTVDQVAGCSSKWTRTANLMTSS